MKTLWLNFEHILNCVKGQKRSPKNTMDCAYRWVYFHKIIIRNGSNVNSKYQTKNYVKEFVKNFDGFSEYFCGKRKVKRSFKENNILNF